MKKFFTAIFTSIVLLSFSSCSIDSDIAYHKDATATTIMTVDMTTFFEVMKDSAIASGTNKSASFEKFPTTWTSYYDIRKKESKIPIPEDSVRLYKKVLMKTNMEKNEMTGFSMKFDRFSDADYASFGSRKENSLPIASSSYATWTGKVLKIDTDKFINKELQEFVEMMSMMDDKEDSSKSNKMDQLKEKSGMSFSTMLRFDAPIKAIAGKHPWVQQVDNKTLKIEYSLADIAKSPKKKMKKVEIIVITE